MRRSLPWRTLIHFAIAVLATIVFVVLAEAVLEGDADAIDRALALGVRELDHPVLDRLMITVTQVGSGVMLGVVSIAVIIALLRHRHDSTAFIIGANVIVAEILMTLLKRYFQRPRPTLFDEITRPETFSFPSGHALSAMAVYGGIAAVVIAHRRGQRAWIVAAATVLIGAIGFSRVYLGVHWPFDVLAGFAAGVPFVVATVHLLHTRGRRLRLAEPHTSEMNGSRRTIPHRE